MAAQAVETYGLPRKIAPHDALLEEVWRTAGHVQWLEARVRQLDPEALVYGVKGRSVEVGERERAVVNVSRADEVAAVSIWLELYQRERRHLTEICKTAIACGIAERQVRLAEQHGAIIARVIGGVLGDLGVKQTDDSVRVAVRKHLMLVSGEAET